MCKYAILYKGFEHPQILESVEGSGWGVDIISKDTQRQLLYKLVITMIFEWSPG